MVEGRRARADQVAKRINTAGELLNSGLEVVEATRALARRHRLSERQARRYVERARTEGAVAVPGTKVVFTVKVPAELARQVRRVAKATGQTISAVVAQALAEFWDR
ncbi:MAG: ribbon-helix-helix domain-containing protein, partial [Actinomycetota bacterium]|nr:ribbon-helix-helix domain-containing protein [Actinomycetota bacterium]